MGEAVSDYLVHGYNPYAAVFAGFVAFAIAILIQFRAAAYVPWIYWLAVLWSPCSERWRRTSCMWSSGFRTLPRRLFFAVALVAIFGTWSRIEGTLSIHSITTSRREMFYWLAVLATFAMGTATGDLAAYTAKLGFLSAGILFACLFLLPAIAWRFFNLNSVLAFWIAYVLTRPLGASFADWMGKSKTAGGLGIGDGVVALVLFVLIAGLVTWVTFRTEAPTRVQSTDALPDAAPSS